MASRMTSVLSKRISRAIFEYRLIQPEDRVLVAVSGGKDSLALMWLLHRMSRGFPIPFSVAGVHVRSEVHPPNLAEEVLGWAGSEEIPLEIIDREIAPALRPGQEINCFVCARQRREALLRFADERGYRSVALGHHMDDVLATLIMNMSWNGEIAAMPASLSYGTMRVIRPLLLAQEGDILRFTDERRWTVPAKTCPYEGDSRRRSARLLLESWTDGEAKRKLKLFESLGNVKSHMLPGQ